MRHKLITGSAKAGIVRLMTEERNAALTFSEIRHAAQFRPGSVEVTAVVVEPEEEITLTLPWPPSMNAYWGLRVTEKGQRIMVVTKQGTRYQKLVAGLVALRWQRPPIDYRVAMLIEAWAPSDQYAEGARWYFDVDNRCKPLLDALQKSGVLENDKHVRDLRIVDRGIDPPGRVVISIRRFKEIKK